ncbi:MAG: SMP-30/gluconolactonase/LRE family protein [Pseudomonadales bacterium]
MQVRTHKPQFLCDGFIFPESPRWHRGSFYCCSIDEGRLFRIHLNGSKDLFYESDDRISGWVFLDNDSDDLLITAGKARKLFTVRDGETAEFADLSALASYRINDMVRTRNGVCFVGAINYVFGDIPLAVAPDSPLLRVGADGSASVATTDMGFANGMVITPNGRTLIVADTTRCCLHQFTLTDDDDLADQTTFAWIPGSVPDGIALDAEGAVWVTTRNRVFRVERGGRITDEVDMGTTEATACMLGGEDGRTLLITASDSYDRNIILDNPSGRLFTARVEVPGAGLP